jgi:hypothetical protein
MSSVTHFPITVILNLNQLVLGADQQMAALKRQEKNDFCGFASAFLQAHAKAQMNSAVKKVSTASNSHGH